MSKVHAEHSRSKLALIAATLPLMAGLCNAPLSSEPDVESLAPTETMAPSPTPVETRPATPPSQPTDSISPVAPTGAASVTQDRITLFYDPSLILDITADTVPAVLEPGPFVDPHPDYISFYLILDSGAVSVVRVQDYADLSDSAEEELQRLKEMIAARPSQVQECIPQPPLSAFYTTCSHQQFNANIEYVNFQNGSGVRFVTVYAIQDAVPVSNEHLAYVFQGLTEDERYYVSAGFHITHRDLEEFVAEIPQEVYADTSGLALRQYFEGYEAMLNAAEGRYQPLLSRFDEMLGSLRIAD
ncbi:MAG: hypothetical protein ACE5JF_04145 [Anaerolineales bacterium]